MLSYNNSASHFSITSNFCFLLSTSASCFQFLLSMQKCGKKGVSRHYSIFMKNDSCYEFCVLFSTFAFCFPFFSFSAKIRGERRKPPRLKIDIKKGKKAVDLLLIQGAYPKHLTLSNGNDHLERLFKTYGTPVFIRGNLIRSNDNRLT